MVTVNQYDGIRSFSSLTDGRSFVRLFVGVWLLVCVVAFGVWEILTISVSSTSSVVRRKKKEGREEILDPF